MVVSRTCAPCLKSAVLKTYAYGWLSARRFGSSGYRSCLIGCTKREPEENTLTRDPMESDDSLEHYMCCLVVQMAWSKFSKMDNDKGPLGMLGLAAENQTVLLARLVLLYCV